MYAISLLAHSLLRWLVLLFLAVRAGRGLQGWLSKGAFTVSDRRLALGTMILVDIQLTLGLVLLFLSPNIRLALADPGAAMKDSHLRLLLVEHPLMMVIAVVLVHVGFAMGKKGEAVRKHKLGGILTGLALIAALSRIPW